jgi:hypothetical protein
MTKLAKKITKIKKNPRFAVYLGKEHADLDEFLSVVPTIFCYGFDTISRQRKNLILIKDQRFINSLNEIELIFVNDLEKILILDIQPLLVKSSPIILVQCDAAVSIEQSNFFKTVRYHAVETFKRYQIWKPIQ